MSTDLKTLSQISQVKKPQKRDTGMKYVPKDYIDVAKGQERVFAKLMLEQMHKSLNPESSTAMGVYNDLMLEERAKLMTEQHEGMGIQEVILDQLYPKKFRNPQALEAYEQMKNKKNIFKKHNIEMTGPQPQDEQSIKIHAKNDITMKAPQIIKRASLTENEK